MNEHPLASAIAAVVADRDSARLAAAVTGTVRLRALLPGGPIEEHGRDAVVARVGGWFADMDTVHLVESAGETVADRLLIHYRLDLVRRVIARPGRYRRPGFPSCTETGVPVRTTP